MGKYIKNLLVQFAKAKGYDQIDLKSHAFKEEFSKYLEDMKKCGWNYSNFLLANGQNFTKRTTAEIGKGIYDTIVRPYNTIVITSNNYGLNINKDRIIFGEFAIYNDKPYYSVINNDEVVTNEISKNEIDTFMINNPFYADNDFYSFCTLELPNWEKIYNFNNFDIMAGVYGKIFDKDMAYKIKNIEDLKKRLYGPIKEDFSKNNDEYYYAISTKVRKR